jgi:hypothetical protein
VAPLRGWLGETWGFWIQSGALSLSALGALWIVWSRARSERRRATVELLIHQQSNAELREALVYVRRSDDHMVDHLADRASDKYKKCMLVLNRYEFTAAAIREKALDEGLFKRMQYTVVIRDWDVLCPFVMELRRLDKHPTLFQEFKWLSERWARKPLKHIVKS